MVEILSIDKFLALDPLRHTLLDVRSPSEFVSGHIPGALSFPLFSDDERAAIGTTYKQAGQEVALRRGLDMVAPRMSGMIQQARKICGDQPIVLHCWRGGKRSGSVAWLLDFAGMDVAVLEGGYKAFRTHQRAWLASVKWNFVVLGGKTGSGKTEILHALKASGEQVLDLEGLANHKGSAFGWIGEKNQPTNENYENLVAHALMGMDPTKRIWVENESRSVGKVFVPDPVWSAMCIAHLIHLEVPLAQRVHNLVETYVNGENEAALIKSFEKIQKRLGGQHLNSALESLRANDYASAARIALIYYDKTYSFGLQKRPASHVVHLDATHVLRADLVVTLIQMADTLNVKPNGIPAHPV